MARVISVMPADRGWQVSVEGEADQVTLDSGSKAEERAIELAQSFVRQGEPARVEVRLRDGSLAARLIAPLAEAADRWRWRAPLEAMPG